MYKERHVNGTKCLHGGIENPDSCLTGVKIFADHANDLVGNKLLCVHLDWDTPEPIKLFDQIVELLQRATGSTGENYIIKRKVKRKEEEVNNIQHQIDQKVPRQEFKSNGYRRFNNRGRGNHHQVRGRGGRGRYSRPFCHICKKNDQRISTEVLFKVFEKVHRRMQIQMETQIQQAIIKLNVNEKKSQLYQVNQLKSRTNPNQMTKLSTKPIVYQHKK